MIESPGAVRLPAERNGQLISTARRPRRRAVCACRLAKSAVRLSRTGEPVGTVEMGAMTVHSRSRTASRAYRGHATTNEMASTAARPLDSHAQALEVLLIAGLAGVFLVNAVVAVADPSEFTALVERSLVGRAIPMMSGRWVVWSIAVHDFAIGVLLLATLRRPRVRPFILAWAGAWLLAVTLVKLTALEALGG